MRRMMVALVLGTALPMAVQARTVPPDAIAQAKALDAERRAGRVRGPLHGVPILIKDNIETADRMATSGGRGGGAGSGGGAVTFVISYLRHPAKAGIHLCHSARNA